MDIARSVNSVPIRLTSERWLHIVENHDEMAGYYDDVLLAVESPDIVLRGYRGSLLAVRGYGANGISRSSIGSYPRKTAS